MSPRLADLQADMQAEIAQRHHWAARVKALRTRLKETQVQFGERFGVTARCVQDWEAASASGFDYYARMEELENEIPDSSR